jgi:prepilin-type N-terminal cleavage/methylation domain-containing protein
MRRQSTKNSWKQSGFALIEMIIAIVILLIGVVAVAKLVPVSAALNYENRGDSVALVIAQRQLDGLLGQPIANNTFTDPQGVLCPVGNTCQLGNPALPNQVVGSPVIMNGVRPLIDFKQLQVGGYSFNYSDPDDPSGPVYDVRWAVITIANGGSATGKRLIVGVRHEGGNTPLLPITLDSLVEK